MTVKIDFCYDILSPFAHVALARLGELPSDVELRPVPVLLGAILSHWGQKGPAEIEAKRLHTYRIATFLGERAGLSMTFPPRHPFNPLGALRILAGADADLGMTRRAFDFVFGDGRAPDNEAELAAFAEAVGAPLDLAGDDTAKARLRANTDQAIAAGVFGVPSFVVRENGPAEVFWGVDSFEMLKAWLGERGMFERAPYKGLEAVEVAVRRN
ncbi:2-hydroxychromene-2-carboxylate isomerase [Pseudohoeflea suaedae]|uniref:2-hydroxychromene-2-carboxylate isomerase n=1 Tax=Pseudohoeflea suaedae TaxID=877384 RepID=A0A4R5PM45_9HYPH|nr:DsbA family protein [Pseudohoeflea suaedae]TDH37949.1 2-hydroxychromene-2-carboxylate isomerase [Pseudohoeflea suaedae]